MRKRFAGAWPGHAIIIALWLLMALALSGCMSPDPIVGVPPTATPDLPPPTSIPTALPLQLPTAFNFPLPAPVHVGIERPNDEGCITCHTDSAMLRASAQEPTTGATTGTNAPTGEGWQKVYLDQPTFLETMHGRYGCISCHGGDGNTHLKETAHRNMILQPSVAGICGDCHTNEVAGDQNGLHANLTGYRTALFARGGSENKAAIETVMENHCQSCHTTRCGQCHVSKPSSLGGGLIAGHLFAVSPTVNETCDACHGSRLEDEYKGRNAGVPGDVHWVQEEMLCTDCHVTDELHGTISPLVRRYDGQPLPDCQSAGCHPAVNPADGIEQHDDAHLLALSCQACHATAYTNCYHCHVGRQDGSPTTEVDPPQIAFKIGLNPIASRYRPWKYVPVRHIPITRDSFAYYGSDLLPEFDSLPTWKYATPHNVQRITPQTATCNSCHGNADVFLTAADIAPDELEANQGVIVDRVPARVE